MCCKRHLICMLLPFDTPPHTPQVYPPTTRYLSFKSPCTISFQHRAVLSCSPVRSFKGLPNFALDWLFATPSLPPPAHVWGMICEHDVSLAILQPRTSYGSSSSIPVLWNSKGSTITHTCSHNLFPPLGKFDACFTTLHSYELPSSNNNIFAVEGRKLELVPEEEQEQTNVVFLSSPFKLPLHWTLFSFFFFFPLPLNHQHHHPPLSLPLLQLCVAKHKHTHSVTQPSPRALANSIYRRTHGRSVSKIYIFAILPHTQTMKRE